MRHWGGNIDHTQDQNSAPLGQPRIYSESTPWSNSVVDVQFSAPRGESTEIPNPPPGADFRIPPPGFYYEIESRGTKNWKNIKKT